MISLIICSRYKTLTPQLQANIEETIGVPYEVVLIDNADKSLSIFEAYNIGVKQSNFSLLCFMHDDIKYHSHNWGQSVIDHFTEANVGAIGIAGSPYFPQMPGAWWSSGLVNMYILPNHAESLQPRIESVSREKVNQAECVVLDGVWLCIRKELFAEIRYDSENFKGFHIYDVDISLQIHRLGYRNLVIYDVLIEHFSKGDMNNNWLENAVILQRKWRKALPAKVVKLSYSKMCQAEIDSLNEFIYVSKKNNLPHKKTYKKALLHLLKFYKGYFYYKTPYYLFNYLFRSLS